MADGARVGAPPPAPLASSGIPNVPSLDHSPRQASPVAAPVAKAAAAPAAEEAEEIIGSQEDPLNPGAAPDIAAPSIQEAEQAEAAALAIAMPPAVSAPSQLVPKLESEVPTCRKCGSPVEPTAKGTRFFTSTQEFQCSTCCCRHVGIIKVFGTLKFDEYNELDDAEKRQFFASLPTDYASLKKTLSDFIIKRRIESRRNSIVGKFLPLAVWAKKGYDSDAIEKAATSADIEDHPVLGLTYRVKIRTSTDETEEAKIREQVASKVRDVRGANPKARGLNDEPVEQPSSTKTSSSSSSSSSSSKKKKKTKKTKKDNKNKEEKKEKKEKQDQS